ncbi:MAG: hypothetical protein FWC16_06860 [Defluviitaleaceae bacterium]|nr:hypothetical protein [Defluviitaleaceae bacterium]MCL2274631.1 hypothetical protein [Defluviitaleaceae bacterium]
MLPKNKKALFIALLAVGALLMLLGRLYTPTAREEIQDEAALHTAHAPPAHETTDIYAAEARLQEFFSLVEGAGRVRVMVGISARRETVFAVDTNKNETFTQEEDAQGGTRETRTSANSQQTVLIPDRNGTSRPLVLRETEPAIEGIVIIAEGGDNPLVRAELTRAAQAVLGIDAHRIQVLTMQR